MPNIVRARAALAAERCWRARAGFLVDLYVTGARGNAHGRAAAVDVALHVMAIETAVRGQGWVAVHAA
jgi:hypothetical protein